MDATNNKRYYAVLQKKGGKREKVCVLGFRVSILFKKGLGFLKALQRKFIICFGKILKLLHGSKHLIE